MINMMYLVLTALLALNVSKETLDVIARVDKSLNQTIENFAAKNNITYAAFENAFKLNPVKVGPWKDKADSVRAQAQMLIDKITQYKWEIVRTADGRDAQLDSIKRQEDLNIPAQKMLVETIPVGSGRMSRGEDLKHSIEGYKNYLLTIVNTGDSALINSIRESLSTADVKGTTREPRRSWEKDNFEYLPLIGVITLMSKMQSDVRNAEADVLNYLFSGIEAKSFKFSDLDAVVIPRTANVVFQGNPYEAEIFLAALDTTVDPEITVGGSPLEIRNGHGLYRTATSKVGSYTWGGVINYTAPDGTNRRFPFESKYEVAPPSLVVSATKMNVLYKGLDNPVAISVPGVAANKIAATMTNGDLRMVTPGEFIARPTADQGEAVISVTAEIDGVRTAMGTKIFRLNRVPPPIAKVGGKSGGKIAKNTLVAQTGVVAELEGFLFDMKFTVKSFKVTVVSGSAGGFIKDETSGSAALTQRQKTLISNAAKDSRVIFEDIRVVGEDEIARELPPISFSIQ